MKQGPLVLLCCVIYLCSLPCHCLQGKLIVTVHYPDNRLPCPQTIILVSNRLTGWNLFNYSSYTPLPQVIMKHNAPDRWQISIPYDESDFTSTIFVRTVMFNPCLLNRSEEFAFSIGDNIRLCALQIFTRNIGKGDMVYLKEDGLTTLDMYPYFCQIEGLVKILPNISAPQLPSGQRSVVLYVPPGLIENTITREVNIFYLYDGQELPAFQSLIDSLVITGEISELVIIGIPSDSNRTYELTPTKCTPNPSCSIHPIACDGFPSTGGFSFLLDFMINTVQPLVLFNLSITTTPQRTGSGGWSLGGLSACEAIYRTSAITKGYCSSPSLWWNCEEFGRIHMSYPKNGVLYIDAGSEEYLLQSAQSAFYGLSISGFSVGGNLWFVEKDGDYHELSSWLSRFPEGLKTLFG